MEATGHARWFELLMAALGSELWIGDPAEIKAARARKQKTDRQDAQLLLKLLLENRLPRLWVPNAENRDLRQLLWHPKATADLGAWQTVAGARTSKPPSRSLASVSVYQSVTFPAQRD
jgi:hypothetical protein